MHTKKLKECYLTVDEEKAVALVTSDSSQGIDRQSGGMSLKQVNAFRYLGNIITGDDKSTGDIKSKISEAKVAFNKMDKLMTSWHIHLEARKILWILMYGLWSYMLLKRGLLEIKVNIGLKPLKCDGDECWWHRGIELGTRSLSETLRDERHRKT